MGDSEKYSLTHVPFPLERKELSALHGQQKIEDSR